MLDHGLYENLLLEQNQEDIIRYKNFLSVPPELFLEMCECVRRLLQKNDTFLGKALQPGLKIAITLRYMATGNNKSLSMNLELHITQ